MLSIIVSCVIEYLSLHSSTPITDEWLIRFDQAVNLIGGAMGSSRRRTVVWRILSRVFGNRAFEILVRLRRLKRQLI